jgi:polysaccharide chain length determinant protein (PEP-CTERM system associated)
MFDQSPINLKEYYRLFVRNRMLFLVPFVVIFCVVSLSSLFFPKVYESSTMVRVQRKLPNPIARDRVLNEDPRGIVRTVREMLLRRPVVKQTIEKLNLDKDVKGKADLARVIKSIREGVTIESKGSHLFSVVYQDGDPERSMQVVSTLVNTFIEKNLSLKRDAAFSSVDFIKEQMNVYTSKLEASEEALSKFKQAHLGEMPGAQNATLVQLERMRDQLAQTNIEYQGALSKKRLIERQLSGEQPMVVSMKSGEASSVEQRIKILQFQLGQLLGNYTEKHPDVIRIRMEIERLREEGEQAFTNVIGPGMPSGEIATLNPLHQKLKEELNNIDVAIGTMRSKKGILELKIAEYEKKAISIPNQEKEMASLQRDYNVNDNIYNMLLMKYEEARIAKQLEFSQGGTRFQVVEPAIVPLRPIKPNILRFLAAGLVLGCATGAGLLFIREYLDTSTKGVRETEEVYNFPVLAAIPVITTEKEIQHQKLQQRKFILNTLLFFIGIVGAVAVALYRLL